MRSLLLSSLNINKIYLFKFFDDLVLIYPFYTLMFADFGVSPAKIGILLGIWSVTSFLLEIPSGVVADKYSRKHILFFAQLARILGYALWILFPTFWGFLAGFILWGIKSAFTSGTYQALIYDTLKSEDRVNDYAKVTGRAKSLSHIAILLASGGAAIFSHAGYPCILLVSMGTLLVSGISVLSVSSLPSMESTGEKDYLETLKEGIRIVWKHSVVFHLILFVSIVHALGGAIDEFFPIFGNLTRIPKSGIALFIALISATQAISSVVAYRFEHRSNRFFYTLLTFAGLIFFIASWFTNIGSLLLLGIYSSIYALISIAFESKIQHLLPSEIRATATSAQGFFVEVFVLIVYFGFGYLGQLYDYKEAFLVFGGVIVLVGMLYLGLSLRGDRAVKQQTVS